MKNLILFLFSLSIISSCSPDSDLLFQIVSEDNQGEGTSEDETTEEEDSETNEEEISYEGKLEVNTTPCDFNLDILSSGDTLLIGCQLDLNGETINIPSNVTLTYDGGEIINGTLDFANGGKIDGNLLNQFIEVKGDITLISDVFQFHPERWDVVQGQTTSDKALKNNTNLEKLFFYTKELGTTTFVIDEFDAYFDVTKVTSTTTNQNFYPSVESINVPSDFHLKMSENTILRVFPTNWAKGGTLLAVREVSNTKISGGVLYGDRDEHLYSNGYNTTEEGQLLLMIHASNNIIIDGVKLTMGSFGGLNINSLRFTFQPDYLPTHDVLIKNCLFDNNRRMSMSITDGYDITVENNTFLNAGQPSDYINGGVVGYAVNVEAVRTRDENGNMILYEKAENIIIRNNVERGSRVGGFTVSIGENVTLEGNDMENKIVYSATSGSKIINNKFTATEISKHTPAILAAGVGETIYNNEISGNEIIGYGVGITIYEGKVKVFNNIIEGCTSGIQLKNVSNMQVYNNTISSSQSSSRGLSLQLTYANNIEIYNNSIDVVANHLYFVELNKGENENNYIVNINNNNFSSTASVVFSNSIGVNYLDNISNGPVLLVNSSNCKLMSNEVHSFNYHGVALTGNNKNITISQNEIEVLPNSNFECIKISSETSTNEVIEIENTCN